WLEAHQLEKEDEDSIWTTISKLLTKETQPDLTAFDRKSCISNLSEQNNQLKNRITTLEDDIKDNRDYIILLENKLENSEISSRKTNLELKNVPMLPDETKEKLINMTSSLFKNIDCEVCVYDHSHSIMTNIINVLKSIGVGDIVGVSCEVKGKVLQILKDVIIRFTSDGFNSVLWCPKCNRYGDVKPYWIAKETLSYFLLNIKEAGIKLVGDNILLEEAQLLISLQNFALEIQRNVNLYCKHDISTPHSYVQPLLLIGSHLEESLKYRPTNLNTDRILKCRPDKNHASAPISHSNRIGTQILVQKFQSRNPIATCKFATRNATCFDERWGKAFLGGGRAVIDRPPSANAGRIISIIITREYRADKTQRQRVALPSVNHFRVGYSVLECLIVEEVEHRTLGSEQASQIYFRYHFISALSLFVCVTVVMPNEVPIFEASAVFVLQRAGRWTGRALIYAYT
ncbi:unnamed protein product, partial [Leptidea sinapis]